MDAFPRGRFCWHELVTPDTAAAKQFYTAIAGWRTQAWPEDPSYTLWLNGDDLVGGLMTLPDNAEQTGGSPGWLPYVAVEDAEGTVFRAEALGATVVAGVRAIPTVGSFALLRDPQGAVFAVLQPEGDVPGHDGEPQRGEFSWHELATTDWQSAFTFYNALFGWSKDQAMDMGPEMGTYQIFGRAGRQVGGMYDKPPEMPAPPHWLCYIKVSSTDATAPQVKRLGGMVLNGPMDVPDGGRVAQCMDPQGAMFALHSVAAQPAAAPAPTPSAPKPAAKPAAATPATARRVAPKKKPAKKKAATKRPAKKKAVKKVAKQKRVKKSGRTKKR